MGGRVQRRLATPLGRLQGAAVQHAAEVALQVGAEMGENDIKENELQDVS